MARLERSYVHGAADDAAARRDDRRALATASRRWPDRRRPGRARSRASAGPIAELARRRSTRSPPGCSRSGLKPGDRVGIWSPNNAEWVRDPVRHRQGRADPGQHQPGLPHPRAGIRAEQGRLPGAGHCAPLQDQRLSRHAARAGAGAGPLPSPAGCDAPSCRAWRP